jgi:hypothetical protein
MPTLETLTQDDLKGALNPSSIRKARGYTDRVQNGARQGKTLTAQVQGSKLYDVEIDVEPSGISAHCSCPYSWGGYCKHIGAVLLKWIQSPAAFTIENAPAPPVEAEYPIEVTPIEPAPTHRPKSSPSWLTSTATDRQRADIREIERWLSEIKLQDLRQMAKQRGWQVRGNSKATVVAQIVQHITQPDDVAKAVLGLDQEHRNVLRALVLLGERRVIQPDDLADVARTWGKLQGYKNVTTYIHHLFKMGLAISEEAANVYSPFGDFVPRAILRSMPPALEGAIRVSAYPPPHSGELCLADPRPFIRAISQATFLLEEFPTSLRPPRPRPRMEKFHLGLQEWDHDLFELQQAKADGQLRGYSPIALRVLPSLYSLPVEAIERLAPVIDTPMTGAPALSGEEKLDFVYNLMVTAGILQPGSPVTAWQDVRTEFLRRNEAEQRAILARAYFQMESWSALWAMLRVDDGLRLKHSYNSRHFKPKDLRTDLVRFRNLVLRVLASVPDGQWIALSDLFHVMRRLWPRFDHSMWQDYIYRAPTATWFLVSAGDDQPLDADGWEEAQGRFVEAVLAGPLHWLGLVDLSLDKRGGLAAFCLHGLADLYWDRQETPEMPPASAQPVARPPSDVMAVEGSTIRVIPSQVEAQAHSLLNRIARLEITTAQQFAYRLDAQTVHQSFEDGAALAELFDEWERWLPIPMPKAIRDQLSAWWEAYGQVRIYEDLTVIEFGDDYALAEMRATTPLDRYLVAEISPRLVIIAPEGVDVLTEALEQAGYTPKQTDDV